MLNIVLCVKAVSTKMVYMNENTDEIYSLNPYDLNALNKLLDLKKNMDCNIICLCMGKKEAAEVLIYCKAMGADEAILLSDMEFIGSDTYATTYAIKQALGFIDFDLIVCGGMAIDGETGQVPYGLAYRLKLFCQPDVNEIVEVKENQIKLRYQEKEEIYTVTAALPMVIAFRDFTTKRGKINLIKLKKAQAAGITLWNSKDIAAESRFIGQRGSKTEVYGSSAAVFKKKEPIYVPGNSNEIAEWLDGQINII